MLLSLRPQWEYLGRRLVAGLATGLIVVLVGVAAVAMAPLADVEESLGLLWMFNLRGAAPAPADVIVIAIDEQSSREFSLPAEPRSWPRRLHAELVRYLTQEGARVVSFDLTFETPSPEPTDDEEFARAISAAGNVLLAESIHREVISVPGQAGQPNGSAVIERPTPPLPVLAQAAFGHAPFLLPKDSRVNTYWTFGGNAGDTATLPVLTFHAFAPQAIARLNALLRATESQFQSTPSSSDPVQSGPSNVANAVVALDAALQHPDTSDRILQRLSEMPAHELAQDERRLVRSLVRLHSSGATSYLNFFGPPRSITTVPYSRVLALARSIDPRDASKTAPVRFKDKVVFVGYSAATQPGQDQLRDDYRTVYSRSDGLDISGVEIAATAFANLVEDRPIEPVEPAWQAMFTAAWGLILGFVCGLLRPVRAALIVSALSASYVWFAFAKFVNEAWWLPSIIPIGVQAPLAVFAGVWLSYRVATLERQRIKKAFSYFLPGAVVDQLARNVGPVAGSNRVVFGACLATDVERYTTLAEQMEPRKLGELMNQYYARLFVPVERSRGVVMDVVGDAMVAIWANASSDAQIRRNACQAALEIVKALDGFNDASAGRPSMPTRFGLHAGDMLVGSIGASGHYEYRAVGDIVNTSSRIQSLNKTLGTRLLASEATMAGLQEFAIRPLGSFLVAGKSNAVAVVELLGAVPDPEGDASSLCTMFNDALDAYRAGRWREASDRFSAILGIAPDDGPSRFYAARCAHLVSNPPGDGWSPTIRVDTK
jgi:adenylate cyclase